MSHRHAPLELRERLYLGDGHAGELARELGAVVLSTCNRTEVYLDDGDPELVRARLERQSGLELDGVLATWEGQEAVEHLFRVAAGLDSLVPGEAQILGQVRLAYEQALGAGATGPVLNRLFEDALHAGKRVRTEARLAEMPESVAASAVDLAERELGALVHKSALLFGAAFMIGRARGIDVMANGIGPLIAFNLIFTFLVGGISIGGHIGGLIGGAVAGAVMEYFGQRRRSLVPGVAFCAILGAAAVAGSFAVA